MNVIQIIFNAVSLDTDATIDLKGMSAFEMKLKTRTYSIYS